MCTLFILVNKIKNNPIAIVLNRDEFHKRESLPLQFFNRNFKHGGQEIIAPKDEVSNGTWFGFLNEKDFKYAALTNIRNPNVREQNKESRGIIIKDFLKFDLKPRFYLDYLKKNADKYNGFNLVFGNNSECFHFNSADQSYKILWDRSQKKQKIYGLSNASLDSNWPKVIHGKKDFETILKKYSGLDLKHEFLWNEFKLAMQNKDKFNFAKLPITGIGEELEIFLSSRFIVNEKYGTRSTLFFLFKEEQSNFFEVTYDPKGHELLEKNINLTH